MHTIIRAIVYATNEQEALEEADKVFDRLCEGGRPFDYYQKFDGEGSPVSGKGRWGDRVAVTLADSEDGKELIQQGLKWTREEFVESLDKIRIELNKFTLEELFEERKIVFNGEDIPTDDMFKYYLHKCGQYDGGATYLYDNDGEGIRNTRHLEDTLDKWKCVYEDKKQKNPYDKLNVYVVPADVHY